MPTKIRLQRFGKKGQPYYRIVVADSRAPRDGRFIENIGIYNPLTVPATIQIDAEKALYWLQVGAQPTETARAILSYKGILYKHHLQKGVLKEALSQEQADAKFNAWIEEKEQKISQKIKDKELAQKENLRSKLKEETDIKEKKAQAIAEKRAKELSAKVKAEAGDSEPADAEPTQDTVSEPEVLPESVDAEQVTEKVLTEQLEEIPAIEEAPVTEETPVTEEAPAAEEAPVAEVSEEQEPKTE